MSLIKLTEAAVEHVKQMLTKQNGALGFKLSIKKTGCSNYSYAPKIIDKIDPADLHFVQQGLAIYIDPVCQEIVEGLVIDYVETPGLGIKQKHMVYKNPQEKNRCGCGESFTVGPK